MNITNITVSLLVIFPIVTVTGTLYNDIEGVCYD
jgi:hypothetical protein